MGSLNQYKIGADVLSLSGQNFALATPAAPTVVPAPTGGSIAASTAVPVKVAARTGTNYRYGGSTAASSAGTATTATGGATNSAVATTPAVRGAVAYDWFVGNFYYTTTVVNKVTITSIPTANQAVPPLLGISGTAPASVPSTDSSANPAEFNGLLATLAGDYNNSAGGNGLVPAGSGLASGATFQSLDGAGFTGSGQNINELDNLNAAVYNATFLSPDAYMCSSVDAAAISKLILGTSNSNTFYTPGLDGRTDVTAGGFITHYVNKSTGTPVRIEVHPNMVPGTLIARTDQVNFPNSGISNVFELREIEGVQDYEYGSGRIPGQAGGGPRFDGEVYSSSTLVNHVPAAQAVLQNIQS
jgi:hypothetical protein